MMILLALAVVAVFVLMMIAWSSARRQLREARNEARDFRLDLTHEMREKQDAKTWAMKIAGELETAKANINSRNIAYDRLREHANEMEQRATYATAACAKLNQKLEERFCELSDVRLSLFDMRNERDRLRDQRSSKEIMRIAHLADRALLSYRVKNLHKAEGRGAIGARFKLVQTRKAPKTDGAQFRRAETIERGIVDKRTKELTAKPWPVISTVRSPDGGTMKMFQHGEPEGSMPVARLAGSVVDGVLVTAGRKTA